MKRIALLLPLLALAPLLAARAEDPATNAPADSSVVQYRTLRDLLARQEEDGSWADGDPAATALALLGFTAGGFLPAPDDEFGPCCERAARFLVGAVPPDGRLPPGTGVLPAQPIVAYSLWELFWATRNPLVHNAARRATRPLLDDQGPDGLWNGDPDLSVWCACALRGAVLSEPFGLARDRPPGFEEELRESVRRALEGFRALGPEPARRATTRWLLVPPAGSVRHFPPDPDSATNAPAALFPDDVKVTVHRHAEGAEEEPHAESAEFAEDESHAESAESPDGRAPSRPEGGSGEAEPPPVESHIADAGMQGGSLSLKLVHLKPSQSVSHIAFGDPNVLVKAWLGDFRYLGYDWNIGIAVLVIENPGETEMQIPLFHEYWKLLVSHKDSGDLTSHRVIDRGPSNKNPERTWPRYAQRIGPHESLAIVLGVPHAQRLSLGDKILVECRPPGFDWKSNWLEIQ